MTTSDVTKKIPKTAKINTSNGTKQRICYKAKANDRPPECGNCL
jgi:hypothetical protein